MQLPLRFVDTPDGEPGLNYLCDAYKYFFTHADTSMRLMAELLRKGRRAEDIMKFKTIDRKGGDTRRSAN